MMHLETIELPRQDYGSKTATLTVYAQDNVDGQEQRLRPAMVICPGGGYEFCSNREAEPLALAFLARGFQAFVLDYTVLDPAGEGELLPHPQRDLARAVALVRERAVEWHVDARRIATLGCSAGGHLCATYGALCRDEAFLESAGVSREDAAVWAQVLCYPVIDLTAGWPADRARVPPISTNEKLLHAQDLVDAGTPATFIWHTASDEGVLVRNTYLYADALARRAIDHDCHVFHRGRHGLSLATKQTGRDAEHRDAHVAHWVDLAVEWLGELKV